MKLRSRNLLNVAGKLGAGVLRAIMATATVREQVEDPRWHPQMFGASKRFLIALWHENLLVGGWAIGRFPHLYTLASDSDDGEIATGLAATLGMRVLRGSSSSGGVRAVKQIVDLSRDHERFLLAITPDGPRGPRRTIKEGIAFLASRCKLPVVCLGVACQQPWRLRTWDRLQIPRPFGRVQLYFTAPIAAPSRLDRVGVQEYSHLVAGEMNRAQNEAERFLGRPCEIKRRTTPVISIRPA